MRPEDSPALVDTTLLGTYLLLALVLAIPGAVVEVKTTWQSVMSYLRMAYGRMRALLNRTSEDEAVE